MPETGMIWSVVALFLLAWLAWQAGRILACVLRIEARILQKQPDNPVRGAGGQVGSSGKSGTTFETFLAEEPSRRGLTKSEQFAAYRKWRRDKGLNWEKP